MLDRMLIIHFSLRANKKELRECRDQIQMFQEMTAVKDQVVVSLTNQVIFIICSIIRFVFSLVGVQFNGYHTH